MKGAFHLPVIRSVGHMMKESRMIRKEVFYKPVPRLVQILAAIPVGLLGLMVTAISILALMILMTEQTPPLPRHVMWIAVMYFPLGIYSLLITWRLFSGRTQRRDGGLFPPIILRLVGCYFLLCPFLLILLKGLAMLDSIVIHVIMAGACFRLASWRKKHLAGPPSQSAHAQPIDAAGPPEEY